MADTTRGSLPAVCFFVLFAALMQPAALRGQAPAALANTQATLAGGGATITSGTSCPSNSQYKAADTYGDGCPGTSVNFTSGSNDFRGGVAVDGQGNVYVADTNNKLIRKYDPKSGVVSRVAGLGTVCSTASGGQDSSGDGCPALQTSFASTPRGMGIDPYGNVLVAGYGSDIVHVLCMAASPLCPNTTGRKQVGYMYRVAGCVATAGGTATATGGTSVGSDGDGTVASPYNNLSGDVTAWGAGSTGNGTCSGSVGEVNQPRGASADKWGNVYIGETAAARWRVVLGPQTSSYFSGTNPLYSIVALNPSYPSPKQGYIYPLLNGFSAQTSGSITYNIPASGGACQSGTGASTATATDAYGDGCQYFASPAVSSTSVVFTAVADNFGNIYFADANSARIRAIYAGSLVSSSNPLTATLAAEGISSPTAGFVYTIAGGGSTAISTTPTLGTSTSIGASYRVAIGPNNNIYWADNANVQYGMLDLSTGYARTLFKNGVNGFTFGNNSNTQLGVGVDASGNVYFQDVSTGTLKEAEAVALSPTTVGSTTTQTLLFHGPVNTASMTATVLNGASDVSVGTVSCSAANADSTMDCSVAVTFTPTVAGTRTVNLAVTALNSSSATLGSAVFPVSGTASGSVLVTDLASPLTQSTTGITPVGVAVDGAGNGYFVDTASGNVIKRNNTSITIGTAPASPSQIAVDTWGNVYVTSATGASVTKYTLGASGTYTSSTVATGLSTPQAVAVDSSGNLYVADKSTGSVVEIAAGSYYENAQPNLTIASGFTNPVGLAIDGNGILYVADSGAAGVFRIANVNGVMTTSLYAASGALNVTATPGATAASTAPTVTVSGLVPVAIAADAGGNVYVQDSASKKVLTIPVSTSSATAITSLSGLTTPSGLAVDNNGNLYSADSGAQQILKVKRSGVSYAFGSSSGTANALSGYISNAGNLAATGYAETTSSEFLFDQTGTSTCGTIPSTSNALAAGGSCSFTAYFNPATSGNAVTSATTLLAAASTVGSLTLTGQEPAGITYSTTTSISSPTPSSPVYVSSGTTASFTVTVSASGTSDVPNGTVTVTTSCSSGAGSYSLSSGAATVAISGCTAGSQSISVSYANTPDSHNSGASFGASSNSANFTVVQASTTVSWTPGASSVQYSAPIGTSVLNAAATYNNASIPGVYVYTATPSGGSATEVNAGTYLSIGAYTLGVTFYPTDSTDYSSSTASGGTFKVTQAATSASLGSTQNLVASDGTGNFTSVQSALQSLPATGGSIYIKPGTYTGFVTVVTPNTSIYGLGGNPSNVIVTNEQGAFSSPYPAGTGPGNNGSQGDQGSATMVVARGAISGYLSGATYTPYGFYGENFTILNTYDTDTTNSNTNYYISGSCVGGNAGLPNQTLYNGAGTSASPGLCNSQALAIWITGDQAVLNNVYTGSLQDTVYAGSVTSGIPARQYWFRGKISGNVDYIFGDAAAVFDHTSIYTLWHGNSATGIETIEAQDKANKTGSSGDYLSGYIMNSDVFTSQSTGMTALYFGRPWGPGSNPSYSTWVMLNSYVDQVANAGYIEFSGENNLPISTYVEYNNHAYTDPATNGKDLNGVTYLGSGGNTGSGAIVNGSTVIRETTSANPGTIEAASGGFQTSYPSLPNTTLSQIEAQQYYPVAFLGQTVSANVYNNNVTNWNPTTAIASGVNGFVGTGTSTSVTAGNSITILLRPQVPGQGAINNSVGSNVTYTIPTGTYTLSDSFNGGTATTLASGSLDASGSAYFTTASLAVGTHSLTWTYSGDSNFAGSTTSTPYVITVNGKPTTTTLGLTANPITYGQSAGLTATVSPSSGTGTPTGTVQAKVDSATSQNGTLSAGVASFSFSGLTAGSHSFVGTYSGDTTYASSTSSALPLTVNQAALTATSYCSNRVYGAANACSAGVNGYQYSDTAATVFSATPTGTTTATRISAPGTYTATMLGSSLTLTTFGNTNYTVSSQTSTFTVTGGAAQSIIFPPLPNFASGHSYQLTAHATSGLPVTYSVTSGSASVSGSTLTVTGTGPVTVQATCTDASGAYAAATPVSRSFTAQ